jgi:hypothetical protein
LASLAVTLGCSSRSPRGDAGFSRCVRSDWLPSKGSMTHRKVWLVYQEYQADTPDIVGLYLSRVDAERVAADCRREARARYRWVVYGDEDGEGIHIASWDVDVHVEEHELQPASEDVRGTVARRARGQRSKM